MVFAYLLLLLIPILAVVYIIWDHRRKTAERDAANAERLQSMFGTPLAVSQAPHTQSGNGAVAAPAIKVAMPTVSYVRRDRLLTPPQTLLYYLLRSGLPDHIVFAQLTLASVLDTAPGVAAHAREEMARRLSDHQFDFIISDRRMRPVAVLKLAAADEDVPAALSSTQRWLAEAGVRYVELDARALPRKETIRAVVLGDTADAEKTEESALVSR